MASGGRLGMMLFSVFAMTLLAAVPACAADVSAGNRASSTQALFDAVDRSDRQRTFDLLRGGADANAVDGDGYTALHRASASGSAAIAAILLDAGADVSTRAAAGETPLHVAASKEVASMLLARGADVNARESESGMTPLFNADSPVAETLIAGGADVNVRSAGGMTPLVWACYGGGAEKVRLLLKRGADVNAGAGVTKTALHVAANWGHAEAAALLLGAGADPNARDGLGWTPLHWAALEGGPEVWELLIQHGADPMARTEKAWSIIPSGSTPLDIAKRSGVSPR